MDKKMTGQDVMRILMLGNSLTAANHMLQKLAKLLGAEVFVHARGGARLAEQLNPETKMGARTVQALQEYHYDYVVYGPATAPERYKDSVIDNGDSFTGICDWFPSGFGEAELGEAEERAQNKYLYRIIGVAT